jgi:hypothetical protein
MQRIQRSGFEIPMLERLRIPYIQAIGGEADGDALGGGWLSRYFVWTQLGFWCSDTCFRKESSRFKRKGHEQRLENLRLLKELKASGPKEKARSRFLTGIDELGSILGEEASSYLKTHDGMVDHKTYQTSFEQRLARDLALADDTEFQDRYINGCEVIDVPRFRTDATGWRSFVDSFMRQIHVESLKKSRSYIYNSIYNALVDEDDGIFDDPEKLLEAIRSAWNEMIEDDDGEDVTVGEYIDRYQEQQ